MDKAGIKYAERDLEEFYEVVAGAIISQRFPDICRAHAADKATIPKVIEHLKGHAGADREREDVRRMRESYRRYLSLFENKLLPAMESGRSARSKVVKQLEEQIDQVRLETSRCLLAITESVVSLAKTK